MTAPHDPLLAEDTRRIQTRTVRVLVAMQIVGAIGLGVAPSVGILLAEDVTGSEALAGIARTASLFGAALFGVPLGTLAARRGRRTALATGWLTAALGAALLVIAAQASLVIPLVIGLLLTGAGTAATLQARFAATDLAPARHRGRALATVVWVGTLGSVLGPNLGVPGAALAARTGLTVYAASFLLATLALALAGAVVALTLRPDPMRTLQRLDPEHGQAPPRPRGMRARLRGSLDTVRGDPAARLAVLAILTAQAVMVTVMTMTPVHLDHHGEGITIIGLTISLHVAGMFALAPVVGILGDRCGIRLPLVIGLVVLVASLAVGALGQGSTGLVMLALVLLGLGWSFVNVSGSALFSARAEPRTRAAAQGGVDALASLLSALAALLGGPVMALLGFAGLNLLALLLMSPLALLTVRTRLPR